MIILDGVDSTNNYSFSLIRQGLAFHQCCILTTYQFKGRGQFGTTWESERYKNILMSFLISPSSLGYTSLEQSFLLTVNIQHILACWLGSFVKQDIHIKWPNDIFINTKKVAGILVENRTNKNQWQWSSIGIGININQTQFDSPYATSVAMFNDKQDVFSLAYQLEHKLRLGIHLESVDLDVYNRQLLFRDRFKKILIKGEQQYARILRVANDGSLLLKTDSNNYITINNHKDIDWLLEE